MEGSDAGIVQAKELEGRAHLEVHGDGHRDILELAELMLGAGLERLALEVYAAETLDAAQHRCKCQPAQSSSN